MKMALNLDLSNALANINEDQDQDQDYGSYQPKGLALNLESVIQENLDNIVDPDFEIEEGFMDSLEAMIGFGFVTESVINARRLASIEEVGRPLIKTVVRGGKLTERKICPEGFTFDNGTCKRLSRKDIVAYTKRAKKAARTRLSRKGNAANTMRKRKKSMMVREKNAMRVNKTRTA
jgi:hypothetical protein